MITNIVILPILLSFTCGILAQGYGRYNLVIYINTCISLIKE